MRDEIFLQNFLRGPHGLQFSAIPSEAKNLNAFSPPFQKSLFGRPQMKILLKRFH